MTSDDRPRHPPEASAVHARGELAYNRKATPSLRATALIIDLACAVTAFFLLHRALRLSPVPEIWWAAGILGLAAAIGAASRAASGRSLGAAAWGLLVDRGAEPTRRGLSLRGAALWRPERMGAAFVARGAGLTLASIAVSAWAAGDAVFRQPIWAEAEPVELAPYLPDMGSGQWDVLPFYFTLGAWPRSYGGKPVFHTLPYEKGPPTRFPGHIVARWDEPSTRVTFEGPKTPRNDDSDLETGRAPRDRIRNCLIGSDKSWGCLRVREATLYRHLLEMQKSLLGTSGGSAALRMKWKLQWFLVRNPAIPAAEQAQGISLSARDETGMRGQERYVLITRNGTHQAIILDYPLPMAGDVPHSTAAKASQLARSTFLDSIRSLRASDELAPGRAWIDRNLQAMRIDDLGPAALAGREALTGDALARLASMQAALLAKISVDPAGFDAFYHLGGTALLLHRHAKHGADPSGDASAIAKPLISASYRYAQDVAPQDPRTAQLQGFWLESQKP